MPTSLFQYEMLPTTWFYVSAIIILATFFKFNRFWSVRNFDLVMLILLTPGLLFIAGWNDKTGYIWLFCVQCLLVLRLILDVIMVRRPILEPNLSSEGLSFSCFFLVFFLIAALVVNRGERIDNVNTIRLEQILTTRHIHHEVGMNPDTQIIRKPQWNNLPPGFRPFLAITERANLAFAPPSQIQNKITGTVAHNSVEPDTTVRSDSDALSQTLKPITVENTLPDTEKSVFLHPEWSVWILMLTLTLIIAGHLLIVFAFVHIGYRQFGQFQTGIACATLYLLHPYSTQMIGRLDHVMPAALILWSVMVYRRPFFAGLSIGAAAALVWYPLCLLPLWCGFYRHRGWIRFLCGAVSALFVFAALLYFSLPEWGTFGEQLIHMAGKTSLMIFTQSDGFWTSEDIFYRIPILVCFVVVCFGLFFVPSHKHLATLIGGSALLMIGVQFLQLYQGGLYLSWYLPLLILTIFRPNLEDRTAQSIVV